MINARMVEVCLTLKFCAGSPPGRSLTLRS